VGPDGSAVLAQPAIERFAVYGRRLYRARVPLGQVGRWDILVSAGVDDARLAGTTVLDVWPDTGTPPLGSPAPSGPDHHPRRALAHGHGQ